MRELPNLIYLQAFEAAARHLSFTRAAVELNCTQAAISQRIRGLEQYFGRLLFQRHPNGLELSLAGKAYLPGVTQALDIAESATRGVSGRRVQRSVTVSAPISFLNLWLAPRLGAFLDAHPGVDVRLNSSIWTDPNVELADVSIAITEPEAALPGAVTLGPEPLVLVAAPALAARLAGGEALDAFAQIEVQGRYPLWDIWADATGRARAQRAAAIRVDTAATALDLATSGCGVTVVYTSYAASALAMGRLIAPFGAGTAGPHVLTLRYNPARRENSAARAFIDWMTAQLRTSLDLPVV